MVLHVHSILLTWPYHPSWDLSPYYCVGCTPTVSRIILFLILFLLVFPSIFLKNRISQACIARWLFEFITHDSQEYVRIGLCIVLYTTTFVLLDISFLFSRLVLMLWKHFPADCILFVISSSILPSWFNQVPKYLKFETCSIFILPVFILCDLPVLEINIDFVFCRSVFRLFFLNCSSHIFKL